MSNTCKGYQLADGTWSTEYKIGDTFEVVGVDSFPLGSTVEYLEADGTRNPKFKGEALDGEGWHYEFWENLKAVNPKPKSFTKKDLKDGMRVTLRDGRKCYVLRGCLYQQQLHQDQKCWFGINKSFKDDLTGVACTDSPIDIMKVEYMGDVLWEREEQTPEQKRIRELEECIQKAQEELNKMGIK